MSTAIKDAVILTPSVGSRFLSDCLASVQSQSYPALEHVVIADGPEYGRICNEQVEAMLAPPKPIHVVQLPYSTGRGGMNGYRICAAFCNLVNAEVIFFLDDDNWFDAAHVESCMAALNDSNADWAFSLRRICRNNGEYLVDDDCDSLGPWRRDASYHGPADYLAPEFSEFYASYPFLVDTSCFAIRRSVLAGCAHHMLNRYWGDALLASHLVRNNAGACTGQRTVNYRLRQSCEAGALDYFTRGNASMAKRYREQRPWVQRTCVRPPSLDNCPV